MAVYAKALDEEFPVDDDIRAVFSQLMRSPRREFESAMPSLGDLLEMVRERGRTRKREQRERRPIAELDALKAQCERERAEDEAAGVVRVKSDTELRLEAILQRIADGREAARTERLERIMRPSTPTPTHAEETANAA